MSQHTLAMTIGAIDAESGTDLQREALPQPPSEIDSKEFKVIKRTGDLVEFRPEKISNAILIAYQDVMGNEIGKSKTRTGMPMGTPFYMSPEQCRGKDVDHRTDFYAFGVVAYQMLAGVYPIDGDDFMTIMMRQMNDMPEPPTRHVPTLPEGVDEAVIQLMEKDPANRPLRLRDSIEALEIAAGISSMGWDAPPGGISAQRGSVRPSTPLPVASTTQPPNSAGFAATAIGTQTSPPLPRPRRGIFYAVGGALVITAAIVAFAVTRQHDEPAPPPPPAPPTAAVAPAVAPMVAPPVVADAAPKRVMVTISGAPEGTEIFLDGIELGAAPGPIQLDFAGQPVVLTFKADGYIVASKPVVPDGDKTLEVKLKAKPRAPVNPTGKHGPNKDDIFDKVDFNQKAP